MGRAIRRRIRRSNYNNHPDDTHDTHDTHTYVNSNTHSTHDTHGARADSSAAVFCMTQDSLNSSFWVMVLIQTIGSIDMPGRGNRKMPAPRQYVAIFVAWLVLHFVSGISAGAERAAAALGWLMVLVGMVLGPFGQQMVTFFHTVATNFPITGTSTPGAAPTSTPTSPSAPVSPVRNRTVTV